jgi:signal transduction histidine kinase
MSTHARAISTANLGERIEVANPRDELGQLAITLNGLLSRFQEAFVSQRRFMADASHELRSPVAILQGELDVTLARNDREARDYRESLEIMQKSVRRLTRIVRDLFLLARGDAGQVPLRHERFYLDDVVTQTVHTFRTLAAERGVTLREEHTEDLVMRGDEDLIQRLAGNLVENAIKNTAAGGDVVVRCHRRDGELRMEVQDRGVGIPPELHEKIFERFFRVDLAHSPASGANGSGAGLGLPIARWIAVAHHGKLWLESSDANGSTFVASFPAEE